MKEIYLILLFYISGYAQLPCNGLKTVNYGGQIYNTVVIGKQCWLKENLNIGTMIKGQDNQTNNSIIEKYCDHDSINFCNIYGGLYQWDEAMQYNATSVKGICPSGWHIPSVIEFNILSNIADKDISAFVANGQGTEGKSGTNASGFSILLLPDLNDIVLSPGHSTHLRLGCTNFWTSIDVDNSKASSFQILNSLHEISGSWNPNTGIVEFPIYMSRSNINKNFGTSIRCIKD
jgi:uncharacterized protein (TIGR02145 family)